MKAVLLDKNDRVLGRQDITGLLWVSAHDGFANKDAITMPALATGWPVKMHFYDLMGNLIHILRIAEDRCIILGDIVQFSPGQVTVVFCDTKHADTADAG